MKMKICTVSTAQMGFAKLNGRHLALIVGMFGILVMIGKNKLEAGESTLKKGTQIQI